MSSPADIAMDPGNEAEVKPQHQQPFTAAENIHELVAVDKSIAKLMNHTATALSSLTTPEPPSSTANPSSEAVEPDMDPPSQKEEFRTATDLFLTTLHSIDVRMKRQILALEEAGIVRLSNTAPQGEKPASKASLKPNGMGAVGNLDVGWLNSRGTRVERDMEMELWGQAREFLEKDGKDLKMS